MSLLIITAALLLISIAAISVSGVALSSKGRQSSSPIFNGTAPSTIWQIYTIAPGVSYASLWATLAAACIGVGTALVQYINIAGRDNPRGHLLCGASTSGLAAAAAIMAFVWSFVATYTSSRVYNGPFPETVIGRNPVGSQGAYSFESWNCQTVPLRNPEYGDCGEAKRWCYLGVSHYCSEYMPLRTFDQC